MLTTRAVTTHFLPFFFLPHIHTSMRTCLISEGEGVGTTDRRVWHMRTFPGAMDETHTLPQGKGWVQSIAECGI